MVLSKINSVPCAFVKIHMLLDGIFMTLKGIIWKVFLSLKIWLPKPRWRYGEHCDTVTVVGKYLIKCYLFKPAGMAAAPATQNLKWTDGSTHPIDCLALIWVKPQVPPVFSSSVLAKRIGLKFLPGTVTSCLLFSCGPCFPCWVVIWAGLRDAGVNGSSSLHSAFTVEHLLFSSKPWEGD